MKRSLEIAEQLRQLRQKIEDEKKKQLETQNPLVLLNNDLALWKSKLQAKANPKDGAVKLVIYGSKVDYYADRRYRPCVFDAEKKWLVEDWIAKQYSKEGVVVAYADSEFDLLPPKLSMMRLALFSLPYMILPKEVEDLPTHDTDCEPKDKFALLSFGFGRPKCHFTEPYLRPANENGDPERDLSKPEDVETLFKARMQKVHISTEPQKAVSEAEKMLEALKKNALLYDEGQKFRTTILTKFDF